MGEDVVAMVVEPVPVDIVVACLQGEFAEMNIFSLEVTNNLERGNCENEYT